MGLERVMGTLIPYPLWPNVYQGNDPDSCGGQFGVSFDPNV
ncbi:hypothetical protein L195_g022963, partial [Trifolium pratense]